MNKILLIFSVSLILVACSKQDKPAPADPAVFVPSAPDTLGTGWSKVGNIYAGETISDIYFTDGIKGYATTDLGVYRTADAGSTWTKTNNDSGFVNIAANGPNALFLSQTKYTYYTGNNGLNIQKIPYDNFEGIGFQEAFYSSSNTVYMVSVIELWKSINGGLSFDPLYNFQTGDGGSNLFFVNDLQGWASRDHKLYKTENGGVNWTISATLTHRLGPICFVNTDLGFYCDNSKVFKTTNSGASWTNIISFPSAFMVTDIQFVNELTGYCCAGTKIYKTTDGGRTWIVDVALGEKEINEIFFLDEHNGWACGKYGYVLHFRL